MAIAIDFGTSNTVISRWNGATGAPELITIPQLCQRWGHNPPVIPSVLYVENAIAPQVVLGQMVGDRGLDLPQDPRYFRNFKRGIGATIQGFLPELDGCSVGFEQVGAWFFQGLFQALPTLPPGDLDSLVVTVPVDSFENYRHWLSQICHSWPVERVQLLDEPTAAALGYGQQQKQLLLVADFGGGTVDFSLVKLPDHPTSQGLILKWGQKLFGENSAQVTKQARVLGKAGKNLGGSDLDQWLVSFFQERHHLPPSTVAQAIAEKLKITLSTEPQASDVFYNEETFEAQELTLTRSEFEQILSDRQFFAQLDELLGQVLQQGRRQGVEKADIEGVLLVGGTGQIPAVQTWLQGHFDPEKISSDRPFSAIAEGALQLTQGLELQDFLYHSYGIRYWDRRENKHRWHPLINRGQPYPMAQPIELFLGASLENQPKIELVIGELGAETGATEVYFDGDRLVTKNLGTNETQVLPLNDQDDAKTIATLNPPGMPGSDRLKLEFWVDHQRLLRVTVEDLLTNQTLLSQQLVTELS